MIYIWSSIDLLIFDIGNVRHSAFRRDILRAHPLLQQQFPSVSAVFSTQPQDRCTRSDWGWTGEEGRVILEHKKHGMMIPQIPQTGFQPRLVGVLGWRPRRSRRLSPIKILKIKGSKLGHEYLVTNMYLKETLLYWQVIEAGEEGPPSQKRQILARRPSYRKILNDLGGGEISGQYIYTAPVFSFCSSVRLLKYWMSSIKLFMQKTSFFRYFFFLLKLYKVCFLFNFLTKKLQQLMLYCHSSI